MDATSACLNSCTVCRLAVVQFCSFTFAKLGVIHSILIPTLLSVTAHKFQASRARVRSPQELASQPAANMAAAVSIAGPTVLLPGCFGAVFCREHEKANKR